MTERIVPAKIVAAAILGIIAGAVGVVALTGSLGHAQTPTGKSLYARLGGYDAIAAVSDDFVGRLAADPQLTKFS